jgi:D-amino-acid oxidase
MVRIGHAAPQVGPPQNLDWTSSLAIDATVRIHLLTNVSYRRCMSPRPVPRPDVLVVGAGIAGLTAAVRVAEAGYPVRIIASELPQDSTSCNAGAIWGPYLVDADDRILPWSEQTRLVLVELAREPEETGVHLVLGHEAVRADLYPPHWATLLEGYRPSRSDELPPGFRRGWWYTAPIVRMPVYLEYLTARLGEAGVAVQQGTVPSLAAATELAPIVVNCTGIGAAGLTSDPSLFSTRGQLVEVENPGIEHFFCEHDESPTPTYFLPHGDVLILGGSAEVGRFDRAPDEKIAAEIRQRCALIEPAVAGAPFLRHRVGLRPSRPAVRLEAERIGRGLVVHNSGHGGAGVTVSWGCANDVLALVDGLAA